MLDDVQLPPPPDEYFEDVLYFARPGSAQVSVRATDRWQSWWRQQADSVRRDEPKLAEVATAQGFALRTSQLAQIGLSRSRVRRRVAAGSWRSPQRGVVSVVDPSGDDTWAVRRRAHALDCAASVLMNPLHVAGSRSAAVLHGLPTMTVPERAQLVVPPAHATNRPGTLVAALQSDEVTTWWGCPVTTVARTVADLLRTDRESGLMAADAALHEKLAEHADLSHALDRMARWPGSAQARGLLGLVSTLPESPLESLVRLRLHDAGFPPPELQVEIAVPGRRIPYRVDMLWPCRRLILEVDGLGKYDSAELRRERRREALLRSIGYRIERVTWADVVERWPETTRLLRRALAA